MKLLIVLFSPASCYWLFLRTRYCIQHWILTLQRYTIAKRRFWKYCDSKRKKDTFL